MRIMRMLPPPPPPPDLAPSPRNRPSSSLTRFSSPSTVALSCCTSSSDIFRQLLLRASPPNQGRDRITHSGREKEGKKGGEKNPLSSRNKL